MPARVRAFSLHLGISMLLALAAIAVVFLLWYPAPLAEATGVTRIFLILLCVDVIVGPLFTLLVYKTGKKSLRLDLGVIITVQAIAFAYGIWTVFDGRPAWLVFNADRFDLVRVNEIDERAIAKAPEIYRTPSRSGPRWVYAQRPQDAEERQTLFFEATITGVDLAQRPQYYRPLEDAADMLRQKALSLEELTSFNPPEAVSKVRELHPHADAWLPLKSVSQSMVVLLHRSTAQVEAIVDLRPWSE